MNTTKVRLGHTMLDNGEDVAVLFSNLPYIQSIGACPQAKAIEIKAAGCEVTIELNDRAREVLKTRGLLVVAIDASNRPVFEQRINAVGGL